MPFDKAVVLNQDVYVCYTILYLENKTSPIFFLVQTRKSEAWEWSWLVRVHRIWFLNFLCMIRPVPLWIVADSLGGMTCLCFVFHGDFLLACGKLFKEKLKSSFHFLNNWLYSPILSLLKSYPSFLFYFEKLKMKRRPLGPSFSWGPIDE